MTVAAIFDGGVRKKKRWKEKDHEKKKERN